MKLGGLGLSRLMNSRSPRRNRQGHSPGRPSAWLIPFLLCPGGGFFQKLDINVNAVLPSTMDTEENRRNMPQGDFSKWVPPEDVAVVITRLVSDDMRPVSGSAITVYGKA